LTLDREVMHYKQQVALKYAELVYFGLWFTPLREALDAFVDNTQKLVTGTVKLSLYKGNIGVAGGNRRTRSTPTICLRSPWATATTRKMPRASSRFWGCPPAPGRVAAEERGAPVKMWSGRFREPLDHDFEQWQRSLAFDWQLLPQEVAASKAHARTIAAAGILTRRSWSRLWARSMRFATSTRSGRPATLRLHASGRHSPLRGARTGKARIGDLGFKLHTGRSRNEQIATDLRLYVREKCGSIAGTWRTGSRAHQPGPGRGRRGYARLHPSAARRTGAGGPLAAGVWRDAAAGHDPAGGFEPPLELLSTGFWSSGRRDPEAGPDDCRAGAWLFSAPTANSMDATSDRDFALEFLQALTLVALHASRFAEEITLYATAEFGFVELPEAFSTGSSAMPQKKNPDLTELVRAKVARINGAAQTVTMLLKGLPLAYNKDLQESQEPLFSAADAAERMTALLARFTAALRFNTAACAVPARPVSQCHGGRDLPRAQGSSLSQGARENWPGGALWFGKGLRTRWPYARGAEAVWAGVRSRFFFEHHPRCHRELPRRDWRHRGGPSA
jgi:argininosuccinate lyase